MARSENLTGLTENFFLSIIFDFISSFFAVVFVVFYLNLDATRPANAQGSSER
ncbi:MAG TPA: hypothetical protein HA254_02710 [Candidatus Diapherotrites archaeon]|uniref:Uncharacterized protein n=1 Tax=Candidatus Iainarchaeum sp. TaxID=3101447 RepID=A0A7J4IXI0_9ARCH|nr:hypothetical protein [Candidatus Diapherotrites archaeon]